jgi:hypothetical protein
MLAAEPPSAKDEVRPGRQNRGQHRGQLLRTLAAVAVEKNDNLGGRAARSDARPARSAVAPARLRHHSGTETNGSPGSVVRGSVVDHHHFVDDPWGNPREERTDDIRLVESRNDERDSHRVVPG